MRQSIPIQPIPILITCVGGTMVPSVLRWLRDQSRVRFQVHGADANEAPLARAFLDAFHRIPMGDDPNYVNVLLEIAEREGIKLIMPWSDGEAFVLAEAGERFRAIGCDIFASPPNVMAVLRNKLETYRTLERAGLSVPPHAVINGPDELSRAMALYDYPNKSVVIKPIDGRGGRGMYILVGRDSPPEWLGSGHREGRLSESTFAASNHQDLVRGETLVMPCLCAPVYDADVLARHGKVQAVVIRLRHNPTGIPWAGNTICRMKAFEDYACAVAQALGLDAVHDIDLMSDSEGNPALLEVNPRMSGSVAATLAAGVSFLDAALAGRFGIELPVDLPENDVKILPYTEAVPL